jgi:transcription elongation factor GreA-like protein/transcription elongation GreA/GreB family factor
MQYFKQFHQHLLNRDYTSYLSLWEEYCSGDDIDPAELIRILEDVKTSDFSDAFGRYVDKALRLWEMFENQPAGHDIFKLLIDIQTSNDSGLGSLVMDYVTKKFGHHKQFDLMIKLVGLRDLKEFQGAVSNMELLCHMHKGHFVFHSGGWGVGEIMDVSFLREQISLEFDYVAGRKDVSFQNAFKTLIPISKEHFLARRFGSPDLLEAFAKEHPVETIKMLLKDLGPKSAAEIKNELCDLVIPESEWTKWWQSTRTKIKKDSSIEVPEELKDCFRLRETEFGHEERLQKALDKKPSPDELLQIIYSFLRDFPVALKNAGLKKNIQQKLQACQESEQLTEVQELQLNFLLEDLHPQEAHPAITQIINNYSSFDGLISNISIVAFKKRALVEVKKHRKDWVDLFLDLLLKIDQTTLRDFIFEELLKAKEEDAIVKKLLAALEHPGHYPNVILWYFKKIMDGEKIPLADQDGKNRFLESFFILLSILDKSGPSSRDLTKKMLQFITNGRYAVIRKIFQGATIDEVQEFLLLATKCLSFTTHDIKIFHSLAEVVHPSLAKLRKKYDHDEIEEEIIWTTEEGLNKIKVRIEEIATVETVENAKEIEVARSHGDLRENSEFKYALERRDRLQGELKYLSDQVKKARVLTKADVSTDKIGVGNVIECEDDKGNVVTYTLLGPWDANTEANILSFQSKLAQDIKGLKVGDTFKIQSTSYKIVKIRNYFAGK